MKKLIYCALALAAGLFASSCQQENLEPVQGGSTVTFTVSVPEVATKAIGDAQNVNKLVYAVYRVTGENEATAKANLTPNKFVYQDTHPVANGKSTISLELINNQAYLVLFWAQVDNTWFADDYKFGTEKVAYPANLVANNDKYSAFYGVSYISDVQGPATKDITLHRPFAQINIAANDPQNYNVKINTASVTVVNAASGFDVAKEEAIVTPEYSVSFAAAPMPVNEKLTVNNVTYETGVQNTGSKENDKHHYVAMNYVFAADNVNVSYVINTDHGDVSNTITNVPVAKNYRTNIIGNLLTSDVKYNVTLDQDWGPEGPNNDDYVVEVVSVASAEDLQEAINNIQDGAEGNIKLEDNIDLSALAGLISTKAEPEVPTYGLLIPNDKSLVLDLNGNTLTQTVNQTGAYSMIQNYGNLTIIDSKGTGKITYGDTGNGGNYVSNTITNCGTLNVKGGRIKNLSNNTVAQNGYPYVIDNNSTTSNAVLNVEGGELYSESYSAIRLFANSTTYSSDVNITDGNIVGTIEFQKPNTSKLLATLAISGGTISNNATSNALFIFGAGGDASGMDIAITGGSFTGNITLSLSSPIGENFNSKFITDGTFTVNPSKFVAPGYAAEYDSEKGKYTVAKMWYMDAEGNYHILNAAGLKWVSENVNTMECYVNQAANIFDEKTVYIENDIDFQGAEWTPIGDYAFSRTSFNGVFDGQNHTISNFKVTEPVIWTEKVTEASYGFFGNVKGTVKNLTIKNATVNPEGGRYSAALVGRLHNGGSIENCHVVESSVTINHWQVGGIVGQNNNGNISNCSVTRSTITGKAAVGAIVGMDMAAGEHIIENCRVTNSALAAETIFEGYEMTYGLAVGLVNASGIILNLNNVVVENNTIKGVAANTLVGEVVDGAKVYVNGSIPVTTAEQLDAAIKAGGEYILMNDVDVAAATYQNVDFTLDGNGYTIRQKEGSYNEYGLFDSVTGKLTLKNIVFDGIKKGAVLRTTGAELTMDNVTVKNCEHTQIYGLFRLIGKNVIKNCKFENNKCTTVITFNTEGDGNTDPQLVQNCEFKNNTCSATAVVHYSTGGSATFDGNKFVNNTLTVSNGATLYLGFKKNCTVTNNLFDGNTVTATSKRSSGGLMVGNAAVVTGNAFVNNTVTVNGQTGYGNNVCASPYYAAIDLSGNYWGGGAPVENDDYYKEYNNYEVIINDYLTVNPFN